MNFVRCDCGKHYDPSSAIEKIEQESGAFSVGLRCPHCRRFEHSFFENEEVCKAREELERLGRMKHRGKRQRRLYSAFLDKFGRLFDEVQKNQGN